MKAIHRSVDGAALRASVPILLGALFLGGCINLAADDVAAPRAVEEFVDPVPDGWSWQYPPAAPPTPSGIDQTAGDSGPSSESEEYLIFFRAQPGDVDVVLCLYRTTDAAADIYDPQQVIPGFRSFCSTQDPNSIAEPVEVEPNGRLVDEDQWVTARLACRGDCTAADLDQAASEWNAI